LPKFRGFSAETETLADVWSTTIANTTDQWVPTGKVWATNSQPIEVSNQNNLRGVAKPGNPIADKCLRAAHEKIVSDLAYVLGLPIPPAILWDRGEAHRGERYCVISAWAFPKAIEWPHARAKLKPAQIELGKIIAGALRAFDTWVAASDRKDDHVLVNDDGDETGLGLAYIDYAFSLSYEWAGIAGAPAEPRPALPSGVGFDPTATTEMVQAIEALEELRIREIVNRVPVEYFSALPDARDVILSTLLSRRANLKGWLKS
jgi:hypothetical protein